MRAILWLVALAATIYSGYWVVASRAVSAGAEAVLADLSGQGLGSFRTMSLGGFPSRFDVDIDAPELSSRDGRLRWSAPGIKAYALAYQPQHVILVWPDTQDLWLDGQRIAVTSSDLRASARFGLGASLPLDHAEAVGADMNFQSDLGWGVRMAALRLAEKRGEGPNDVVVGAEIVDAAVTGALAEALARAGIAAEGGAARLDAALTLDRPLDRAAAGSDLRILAADIRSLTFAWGALLLKGSGQLAIDPAGLPEGRIELDAENWRTALAMAVASDLVRAETAPTFETLLANLATMGGDPDALRLPLIFAGGRMSLGPIPLGPAPRF